MKKRFFCMMLAALMLIGSALAAPGTQLGFDVLRTAYEAGENCVLSPVSLAYALSMAAQGAQGETRRQMLELLGTAAAADIAAAEESLTRSGLMLANAAFLTGDLVPKAEYTEALRGEFGAKWFENEGDMAAKINAWAEDYTDGMIDRLLDGPLPEDAALVLANAVSMQAKWRSPFSESATGEAAFHAEGGDVAVEFMNQKAKFQYGERDGVQLLRMDYVDSDGALTGLHMLLALPEPGGVPAVLEDLQAEGLDYFTFGEERIEVRLSMPKLDISAENKLAETLYALGMENAFSDSADFSGISDEPMQIGEVLQKARVQVDEEGTKAAAVTAVLMFASAAMPQQEPIVMRLDHPFVFLIVDEGSGSVCFAGVVENPSK